MCLWGAELSVCVMGSGVYCGCGWGCGCGCGFIFTGVTADRPRQQDQAHLLHTPVFVLATMQLRPLTWHCCVCACLFIAHSVNGGPHCDEIRRMCSCLHMSRSQYRRWTSSMRSDTCITHTCFPACMCPDHSINSKPHCDEIRRMCDTHLCSCLHVSRSHYQRWASLTRSDTCITHTCVPACMCPDHIINGGPR